NAAPRPTAQVHVRVKSGDTLFDLSRRQGISVRTIIDANRLRPPYKLRPGQRLKIPPPRRYRVVRGDTLYGISRRFRVDAFELARLNRLARPYNIYRDQLLYLPGAANVAEPNKKAARKPRAKTKPGAKPISLPPVAADTKAPRGRFIWPVSGRIVSGYGPKGEGLHNDGINIAAPRGSPVRAASAGTVAYAGNELRGFGNLLLIRHAGGWMTAYAHNQELLVKRGDNVSQGQPIARVGTSGRVKEPQLHFEIRRGRRAIDPARQLAAAPASS
ncbi:MAG: M23 family metallopeptidase, partial [Pseudomonadota bacterium]|nr:M23 family metallopeptidase [Pseudomonadota bacterium]